MAEEADRGSAERERVHHGVSFEQWAFVLAGLGDGLAQEELLAHLRVDDASWERASAAFHDDVLDDVEAAGTLSEQLDEAMRTARRSWTRPLPPLDVELRAWLDFYRAWAAAASPMEFLEGHGLRAVDIHRLQDHWLGRLAEDAALREDAGAILQAPSGPVPAVRPERARLVADAPTEDHEVTGAAAPRARAPLPFAEGESAPAHPRLSVPLPVSAKTARRTGADETRVAPAGAEGMALPFRAPEAAAQEPEASTTAPDTGATPPAASPDDEPVPLSIERYAALCVDLIDEPHAHARVLARYGITAAQKLMLDVHWTQKMAEDTTTWLAWECACTQHRAGGEPPTSDDAKLD